MIKFGELTPEELKRFNKAIDDDKNNSDIRLGDIEPHEVTPFLYVSDDKEGKDNE